MVTALLAEQGLTVGTYTSPNLSRVNERIARNGEPIDDESFVEVLGLAGPRSRPLMEDRPTRFELLTAAAFAWFADEAVDVAVVEVGLGGSWDCTNVVDADVAVLTNISYDHTEVLGPTLEDIARDKAGIIKPGSRVVIGETDPTLLDLIRTAAAAAGAVEVWVRGEDFACVGNRLAVGGRLIDVRTPGADYGEVLLPLHGAHQGDNAACAWPRSRRSSVPRSTRRWSRARSRASRCPGGSRSWGATRWWSWTGRTTWPECCVLARRRWSRSSRTAARSIAVVGMLSGRDPVAMLEPLRDSRVRLARGLCAAIRRARCRPKWWPRQRAGLGMEVVDGAHARTRRSRCAVATSRRRRPRRGVRFALRGGRRPASCCVGHVA